VTLCEEGCACGCVGLGASGGSDGCGPLAKNGTRGRNPKS
jgi:hypothetical protein